MAITAKSKKRDRTYTRKFDYAVAQEMRDRGLSYAAIARELGVSPTAVVRATDPDFRGRMYARTKQYLADQRRPCKGGCGKLVWMTSSSERTGYCASCLSAVKAQAHVREDTLCCSTCKEWKPDEEFGHNKDAKNRRYRRYVCKKCSTKERTARAKRVRSLT